MKITHGQALCGCRRSTAVCQPQCFQKEAFAISRIRVIFQISPARICLLHVAVEVDSAGRSSARYNTEVATLLLLQLLLRGALDVFNLHMTICSGPRLCETSAELICSGGWREAVNMGFGTGAGFALRALAAGSTRRQPAERGASGAKSCRSRHGAA